LIRDIGVHALPGSRQRHKEIEFCIARGIPRQRRSQHHRCHGGIL